MQVIDCAEIDFSNQSGSDSIMGSWLPPNMQGTYEDTMLEVQNEQMNKTKTALNLNSEVLPM